MTELANTGLSSLLKHSDSVSQALRVSSQSFDHTRSALNTKLSLRDCQQQPLSHSVSEAQAAVQAREDEKKKQQARKDKAKSNTPTPAQEACPGAEQGAESTKSAYWLFMEARPNTYSLQRMVSEHGPHNDSICRHTFVM